jgi:hypothetical protein
MTRLRSIATLLCAAALAGCGENAAQTIAAPATGASIKFFHFGVNAPGVNFYAGDRKLTAISTTACTPATDPRCTTTGIESTTGTAYGAAGAGALYLSVPAGQQTFSGRIAAATDNGLPIASVPSTLADGKFYSYYLSGFYSTTTKTSDAFILEDALPESIDYTMAYVRFVNAISNSSPMTLHARSSVVTTQPESAIGGLVAYKAGSAFVAVPVGVYELHTRVAGSSANLVSRLGTNVVTLGRGRAYTVTARGDITVASSGTAVNRAFLDLTLNR